MRVWDADEVQRQIELGEDSLLELKEVRMREHKVAAPKRNGAERIVRFIDMFGASALVEYEALKKCDEGSSAGGP